MWKTNSNQKGLPRAYLKRMKLKRLLFYIRILTYFLNLLYILAKE